MSTRRAKQLVYGALYLIVFALFFWLIYSIVKFVVPTPATVVSCTSDCLPTDANPIATSSVQVFVSSTNHYTFLAQVANTSAGYAAQYFDYAINLYDASGTVIQSIPGSSFAYANETKYIVVPNETITNAFVSAGITITNPYWVSSSSLGLAPQFSQENVTATVTSSTVSVSGRISNVNIVTYRYVYVEVLFRGTDGNIAGASQTVLNNVAPGRSVDFSVSYPQTGAINPAASQVLVYGLK